jgi:hypothetical protein
MLGLYLYATGAQRQTITVLSTLGLSESYGNLVSSNLRAKRKKKAGAISEGSSLSASRSVADVSFTLDSELDVLVATPPQYTGTLRQLSQSMRANARSIAANMPYSVVYDNINMMFRNSEQIVGRHGKLHRLS